MDYRTFQLNQLVFTDEIYRSGNWSTKVEIILQKLLAPRMGAGPMPVRKKINDKPEYKTPSFKSLLRAIKLDEPQILNRIPSMSERVRQMRRARRILYLLFSMVAVSIISLGMTWVQKTSKPLVESLGPGKFSIKIALGIVFLLFMYLLIFVVIRTAWKLASVLTNKKFADINCILAVIYLIIELSRDDVLDDSTKKRALTARMSDLARNTLFLASHNISKSEFNQAWVKEHFKRIEAYIRERERWAIVPVCTTLTDLRNDFYSLAKMYINGTYGDFVWTYSDSALITLPQSRLQRILSFLPRIIGIVLPLAMMAILLWRPDKLQSIGIGTNVIMLILLAWLLLAIDAALRLGVVSSVINLAKEIKNLK